MSMVLGPAFHYPPPSAGAKRIAKPKFGVAQNLKGKMAPGCHFILMFGCLSAQAKYFRLQL
jgi:hypothetical protein